MKKAIPYSNNFYRSQGNIGYLNRPHETRYRIQMNLTTRVVKLTEKTKRGFTIHFVDGTKLFQVTPANNYPDYVVKAVNYMVNR